MKKIFFLTSLLIGSWSFTAPRVNNGGGAWICTDRQTQQILWIQMSDLVSVEDWHVPPTSFQETNEWQIFSKQRQYVRRNLLALEQIVQKHEFELQEKIVLTDQTIEISEDNIFSTRPRPETCYNGVVAYKQIADFITNGDLLIDVKIWNHPLMTKTHKAILLWHEFLYKIFREEFHDENSSRACHITGLMFLQLPQEILQNAISTALSSTELGKELWSPVKLFPALMQCHLKVHNKEKVIFQKTWDNLISGRSYFAQTEDFVFSMRTDFHSGFPETMKIYDVAENTDIWLPLSEVTSLLSSGKQAVLSKVTQSKPDMRAIITCENVALLDMLDHS